MQKLNICYQSLVRLGQGQPLPVATAHYVLGGSGAISQAPLATSTEQIPNERGSVTAQKDTALESKRAQTSQLSDAAGADLREQSQSPISNVIRLLFQNNTNFGVGQFERTQNILNIQPVIATSLGKDWFLIDRTIVPLDLKTPLNSQSVSFLRFSFQNKERY